MPVTTVARSLVSAGLLLTALPCSAEPTAPKSADAPYAVAGGTLDPAMRPRDVYLERPAPATADPNTACTVAERYVALVNAGHYKQVADLFAEDAVLMEPGGQAGRGREQINAFYTNRIGGMRPTLVPVAYVGNQTDCMVELAVERQINGATRFTLTSIDHFTVDPSGKAARMVAFNRR